MKIIGWHLLRLAAEARHDLVGMTVESIRRHAQSRRLLLILGSPRGKRYLVLAARGQTAFFWSRHKEDIFEFAAFRPTESFNRLRDKRLTTVEVPRPDRLVELHWSKPQDDGSEVATHTLVIAWMGGRGNIWLVDPTTGTILERSYVSSDNTDEAREPSDSRMGKFVPPLPPSLVDWRSLAFPEYVRLRQENASLSPDDFFRRHFWGIDAALASQITGRIKASGPTAGIESRSTAAYWIEFETFIGTLRAAVMSETSLGLPAGDWSPEHVIVARSGESIPAATTSPLAFIHTLCDRHTQEEGKEHDESTALHQAVAAHRQKLSRRITALQRAIDQAEQAQRLQHEGDLLSANRHLLQRGLVEVTVADWDEGGTPVTIPLDPSFTPQENIAAIYNRARKAARNADQARAELPVLLREQDRWKSICLEMDKQVGDTKLLAEARRELGLGPDMLPASQEARPRRLPYREFALDTDRIWVGRSSRDNDELTLRHARPDDLFLHAQGCPGSHVILKRSRRGVDFDHQTIVIAAQIAAFFSRAKHAGLVPVAYTEVRHVKKPRKAPPGTVRLEREESLMVRPLPPPGYHGAGEPE
jgi:predicted ribosome quality control (RQC) complex YloA/Tae2 family protein